MKEINISGRKEIRDYLESLEIPDSFYERFFKEVSTIFVFSTRVDEEDINLISGTSGWVRAFFRTCELTNNKKLLSLYDNLYWADSDYFDEYLEEQIVRVISNSKE